MYGALFVVAGLFFSAAFTGLMQAFPSAILGAVLLVEAAVLVLLVRDLRRSGWAMSLALGVALCCLWLPQGYLIGLMLGVVVTYGLRAGGIRI